MIKIRCIQAVTALLAVSSLTGRPVQTTELPPDSSGGAETIYAVKADEHIDVLRKKENPISFSDYERGLEAYREDFIEMYSSNAMKDTDPQIESQMAIQEKEIQYDQQMADLTAYSDLSGERLRYRVNLYGETMRSEINYYFCDAFTAVSVEEEYYSSWFLNPAYADILYTTIDNYIIVDGTVYIVHDNDTFEKTDKEKAGILLPDEMLLP